MPTDWGNDDPVVTAPVQNWGAGDPVVEKWGASDPVVSTLGAGDQAAISALIGNSETLGKSLNTPIVGYGRNKGIIATVPSVPQLPEIPLPGVGIPADVAAAGVNTVGNLSSGLTTPTNAMMLTGAGAVGGAAPIIGRVIAGGFAADMGHSAYQQIAPLIETIKDPSQTRQQKLEAGGQFLGTLAMTTMAAVHAIKPSLATRLADKTPEAQAKAIREDAAATEDQKVATALTDAADALEKQLAAKDAADKIAAEQQKAVDGAQAVADKQAKAAQDIQKAQAQDAANAQKAAAEAAKPPEVPKSTQILMDAKTPPPLANVATEIGTQTSPFALQGKLNELTGTPPPEQVAPAPKETVPQLPQLPTVKAGDNLHDYDPNDIGMRERISAKVAEGKSREQAVQEISAEGDVTRAAADALPIGSRVRRKDGKVYQKYSDGWSDPDNHSSIALSSDLRGGKIERVGMPQPAPVGDIAPVQAAEAPQVASNTPAGLGVPEIVPEKATAIRAAVKDPATEWQFSVQRGPDGKGGFTQVDAIQNGENTVSSNVADLNKAGAKLPEVPEWVPQGSYSLPQLKEIIKQGEPKNAIPEQIPNAGVLRPESQKSEVNVELPAVGEGNAAPEVPPGNEVRQGAVQEPLRPTAELRLNNADIGMKPVSSMKPAELRAELEAGGAKATPKGVPLEDANTAQLMDAVGRMRRGQYLPPADIIDRLEARKRLPKRPKGEVASAGPDLLYDAAHDAALDVAILGIRAGRALAEVLQMAIAKFRSLHPKASEEDITRLTKDITEAHGTERTTPLTEAEQMMANAPAVEPVAGRPAEVTQEAARVRSKFSQAEKWADDTLARIRKEGRSASGLDPQELAAHTIKLTADLGRGTVEFAKWSADKIKEAGEAIKPYLQQIWDAAHKEFETQRTMDSSERGVSKSALGKYDYIKTSNKAQIEAAQPILDYVKQTGDFNGGFARLAQIENTADRGVAAAVLLREAESITDPYLRDRVVARLAREAKGAGTDAAQGLQAQATVNEILTPYSGHLAWMDVIQSRFKDKIEPIFGTDAAEKVNKGFKEAGDRAAGEIGGAIEGQTNPNLESVRALIPKDTPKTVVTPDLGKSIMDAVRQSAGYREFFTKRGVKTIANRFWQFLADSKKPEGNIWTFDTLIGSELGRILEEKLKDAGIEPAKKAGIPTEEKIAQFLSNDPLRADKVKAIDEAVRADIAKRPEEDQAHLSELWDSIIGAMADSPASDTMARRIVQETIKQQKIKWSALIKSGEKAISEAKSRVVDAISAKVGGVSPGGDKLDLTALRSQVGKVFDEIAGVRKSAYDKSAALAEARSQAANTPEAEANRLLNQFAKLQSDTQAWTDKTSRPVKALLSDFLSGKSTATDFLNGMDTLGVKRATSETLLSVAERQKSVRETWKQIADNERLLASLDKNSVMLAPMRRIAAQFNIKWDELFKDLPEKQADRKAEIFKRLSQDPKFAALTSDGKAKLADAMEAAWEHLRNNIFRQDFSKLVPLPNIPAPDRIKLEETLPELTKQANLGLLDNEAFLNALANRYGIERLDSETGAKLRELGQKAARTPEGSERNEVFQEILDTIMKSRGVKPFDFLTDFWYRNVMSAPRTAVEIGAGGIIQGAARTFLTAADTAIAQGRPDLAFRMAGMFMRDMGVGVALGADLIKTGDRTSLPRYTEQFLAKMDKLEKGKSPGGEIESLYRRSGKLGKAILSPMEMTGRALTALDYIGGQGVRNQQMLYAALTRGDKASFDAAMKQFDKAESARAWAQAKQELPNGRAAQIIARSREIMNAGISEDIRKFGNQMTEVTALNATPVGLSGLIYKGAAKLPMWVRAPTGLGFVKAALNLAQEYSNYAPITGQINALRTMLPQIKSENIFNKALSLGDLPPERKRSIIAAQATGLALLASAANKFLTPQDGDKEGKPRQWEISGSWMGLTPTQKGALMSAGEKPYAIKLPSGRWIDYKLTPYLPALAMIGHVRDQERFNGKKWTDEELANKMGNAWLGGLAAVKDLSLASQFSDMAGILAADDKETDMTKGLTRKLADTVGSAASGLIPMNSLLREIDTYTDPQRYRADSKNPGIDLWLKQVPFVRRTVGEGADGSAHPILNFLGQPIKVSVTPFNRHIGELPSTDPVTAALSEKVSLGMKLPVLSQDSTVVSVKDGKPVQQPMTPDEAYFYQKSVRQAYARQLASDLQAFAAATPEQAALYSQAVMTNAERYVRDRMNLGKPFDGVVPVDSRLSSALTPEYQQTKELNTSEAAPSAIAQSKLRVAYDRLRSLPDDQKPAEYRRVAQEDPKFAMKLVQYAQAPAAERTALEKSEGALGPESRAAYVRQQMLGLKTPAERTKYLQDQFRRGLLSNDTLMEMQKLGGVPR